MEEEAEQLVTVTELAKRLKVRPRYIYRLVAQGLPCLRIGKRRYMRFEVGAVLRWIEG